MITKNQLKASLLLVLSFLGFQVLAQFNRNQAIDLVTQNILNRQLSEVNVYTSKTPLSGYIKQINGDSLLCPYSQNWVFATQNPRSVHKSSFIFVNAQNGAYMQQNNLFVPLNQTSDYEMVSQAHPLPFAQLPPAQAQPNPGFEPNDHSFALIYSGFDGERPWLDVSLIYNTLIQAYGYKKENIYVHYWDGTSPNFGDDLDDPDGSNDIDFASDLPSVQATLNELAGITNNNGSIRALGKEDQLALFFTNTHASSSSADWYFHSSQLQAVSEITNIIDQIDCAQMTIMSTIYFGREVYHLFTGSSACKNKFVHFSEYDWLPGFEWYISGGRYNEYLFYWAAAARGYYPVITEPWRESGHQTSSFPFTTIEGLENHPGDFNPDTNGDKYIQMEEAFAYANAMHTNTNDGYYYNPYTNDGHDNTLVKSNQLSFQKDILTLGGIAGNIKNTSGTINGSLVVGGTLELDYCNMVVPAGSQLTLLNQSKLEFHQPSQIEIANNALLKIGNNVELNGTDPGYHAVLRIIGDAQIGDNLLVKNWWKFKPLYTQNFKLKDVSFENSFLHNYGLDITIENSTFTDSYFWSFRGDVNISNTDFTNTEVKLEPWGAGNNSFQLNDVDFVNSYFKASNANITVDKSNFNTSWFLLYSLNRDNTTANVTNCLFSTQYSRAGIDIHDFDNFNISNNTMNGMYNGIQMNNCGYGNGSHIIKNNKIYNSDVAALNLYNSISKVENNNIYSNSYGILLYNNCQTEIKGNPSANTQSQTQQIINNSSYELKIADAGSLPWYVKYNVIKDDDNNGGQADALVYFYNNGNVTSADLKYNCWGDEDVFDPDQDFYPANFFNYTPEWCPGNNGIPIGDAEALYTLGKIQFENREYLNAKETFKMVIDLHPSSRYADAAMKDLLAIEKYLDKDYKALQSYYNNNPGIQNNNELQVLSKSLSNKCDEEMKNWQAAIDYYETIIQNPPGLTDSVFAIIDLGHLHLVMESDSSSKSAKGIGKMTEHIPGTKEEFNENKSFLLSLLPPHNKAGQIPDEINTDEILKQNSPNPFSGITKVDISLEKSSKIELKVSDMSGRIIRNLALELVEGNTPIHLNMENEPNGVYYYTIYIEGVYTESKKMLLVK